MAASETYTPIATTTLSSATASYTFSSIPSTYTDLILVVNAGTSSSGQSIGMRFNSDSGNNYSSTDLVADASGPASGRTTSTSFIRVVGRGIGTDTTLIDNGVTNILNYSNSATYKPVLNRSNVSGGVIMCVAQWRSTAAITSITIFGEGPSNLITGTTLTLYGITAA